MVIKFLKYLFIFLVVFGVLSLFNYFQVIDSPLAKEGEDILFVISKGEGVKKISQNLLSAGLIKSSRFFEIYAWTQKKEKNFQAGAYNLNPQMNIKEIVEILTSGRIVKNEKKITIIEGWNVKDIGEYFEKEGVSGKDEFLRFVGLARLDYRLEKKIEEPKDYSERFSFLKDKPKYYGLEGYLFPDTYLINNDSSLESVVLKMLENFEKKVSEKMLSDIASQGKTIYEIITMASVIEKEVRSLKDMKIVSGIFWKRIREGYPLQSCATLAYILGENKPVYSLADTKIDSPYNTYKNYGLPPGPICNPGLAAIEAAIYPEKNDYLFFLSKKENGETVFSRTLEEHNLNKAKYLK